MFKYKQFIWLVVVTTVLINCSGLQIAGGGGSETVAIVTKSTTISGTIKSDQLTSTYDIVIYSADYIPDIQTSGKKWDISLSNDGTFQYTLDSGMYNLIVTNTDNGNCAIIQNIRISNGIKEHQEKKLESPGNLEISIKELSPLVIFYIVGTPFYADRIENNTTKIKRVPAGRYKIGYILLESGETAIPDSVREFTINSNETSFITILTKNK